MPPPLQSATFSRSDLESLLPTSAGDLHSLRHTADDTELGAEEAAARLKHKAPPSSSFASRTNRATTGGGAVRHRAKKEEEDGGELEEYYCSEENSDEDGGLLALRRKRVETKNLRASREKPLDTTSGVSRIVREAGESESDIESVSSSSSNNGSEDDLAERRARARTRAEAGAGVTAAAVFPVTSRNDEGKNFSANEDKDSSNTSIGSTGRKIIERKRQRTEAIVVRRRRRGSSSSSSSSSSSGSSTGNKKTTRRMHSKKLNREVVVRRTELALQSKGARDNSVTILCELAPKTAALSEVDAKGGGASSSSTDSFSSSGSSSSSSSSSDDDDSPPLPSSRPLFVPRSQRGSAPKLAGPNTKDLDHYSKKKSEYLERRAIESRAMVAEIVSRSEHIATGAEGSMSALEGEEVGLPPSSSDDDEDEKADHSDCKWGLVVVKDSEQNRLWKLREVIRILTEHDELAEAAFEAAERERRRNLTDAEVLAEDTANERWVKKVVGMKANFMQRYFHRGAYYMDEDTLKDENDVRNRTDYRAPTGDDKLNKKALPKVMQVKKFGFAGYSTKYKGLAKEDTTDKSQQYLPWLKVGESCGSSIEISRGGQHDIHYDDKYRHDDNHQFKQDRGKYKGERRKGDSVFGNG